MNQYTKQIRKIKKYDKTPYKDIVFLENKLRTLKKSVTKEQFYKVVEKKMDKETYNVILTYLLKTTRFDIDKETGCLYTAWDPVGVEKILENKNTVFR